MSIVTGRRPDLTAAQVLSTGPVLAVLTATAGLWTPRKQDVRLLGSCVLWASALVLADAALRAGRGIAARPLPSPVAGLESPSQDAAAEAADMEHLVVGLDDDELEPLPPDAPEEDDSDEVRVDPQLTRSGEVDEAAGKPVDFR